MQGLEVLAGRSVRKLLHVSSIILILTISLIIPAVMGENTGTPDQHDGARTRANTLPIPVLEVSQAEVLTLEPILIDASGSYDSDGAIAGYFFQFEDGTESGWVTTPVVEHTYLKERFYTIRLRVMDDTGSESSYWETLTVNIVNRLPYIVIEDELKVYPDEEVVLEGYRSWDQDGYIINYSWEFEDNTTLYGPNVSHVFHEPGIYNIFLLVLDDDRKTNKSSLRVVVQESSVSESRTLMGLAVIAFIAFVGVSAILFGRRVLPAQLRARAGYRPRTRRLEGTEADLVHKRAENWFERYKTDLPVYDNIVIHDYNEPYIYHFALFNLHRQSALESVRAPAQGGSEDDDDDDDDIKIDETAVTEKALKVALGKHFKSDHSKLITELKSYKPAKGALILTTNGTAVMALALANAPRNSAGKPVSTVTFALNIYHSLLKKMARHELLGGARYYVPRTAELEAMAAFTTLKVMVYRHAMVNGANSTGTDPTDQELEYIDSIVTLMGRCWKAAHSFQARPHSVDAKLYITIILCEKAGKHRFGYGNINASHDPVEDDDELDRLEDMLDLYNQTWAVLQFDKYSSQNISSKEILALHTFDTLGAQRYLNRGGVEV